MRPAAPGSTSCAGNWPTCAPRPTPSARSGRPSGRPSAGSRSCAQELERSRREAEEAERAYDLNRAAELRYGRIAELERRLQAEEEQLAAKQGQRRLLREVVTEDEIAEIVVRLDRHPGQPAEGGRAGEAAAPRRDPARAGHRPGRGGPARRRRDHPGPLRHQGPAPADRLVHLPRPDRRRQDRAGQDPRGGAVRHRGQHRPPRHERVPGAAHRQPAGRCAARLRRLRGGRPAHRGGAPQAVLGRALRRDREGARGRLQHAAAGPRRRTDHRRAGPHRRLPQHRHHHDLEHRRRVPARRGRPPTARSSRRPADRSWPSCARTSGPSSSTASTTSCCSSR